jgi:hypothetical protein
MGLFRKKKNECKILVAIGEGEGLAIISTCIHLEFMHSGVEFIRNYNSI